MVRGESMKLNIKQKHIDTYPTQETLKSQAFLLPKLFSMTYL